MMENCYDEGTLQAFLDNELNPELTHKVSMHIGDCDSCAFLFADIEEETDLAFTALEQEFDTLVPTQRLWTKINDSIETEKRNRSIWQSIVNFKFQISSFKFNFANLSAMASLLFIFSVFGVLLALKPSENKNIVAVVQPKIEQNIPVIVKEPQILPAPDRSATEVKDEVIETDRKAERITPQFRVEKASFVKPERESKKPEKIDAESKSPKEIVAPQYIDGEESYVKTVARLENTVNNTKDAVLSPSAQVSFEKDLAIVNDSIVRMKKEIKKNPKNEGAKQILFASYQNKIDLLNSVSERGALMASMR